MSNTQKSNRVDIKLKAKMLFDRFRFMWIAILLLTVKTYIAYKIGFNIKTDNLLQEFLLFINPISSVILLVGLSMLFSDKFKNLAVIIASSIVSLILYANLLFYRFFADFLTWPVLLQTSNAKGLSGSAIELISVIDIVLFLDIIVLLFLYIKNKFPLGNYIKRERAIIVSLAVIVFFFNVTVAQLERPQILTRAFDRELLVKNIGIYNYQIYDGILQSRAKAQRVFADSTDIMEVLNYTDSNNLKPDDALFGVAKNKNLVVISLESMQSFLINETINGKEITPFLNDLITDSYYFDNFYHQTGQGKTSDSEFLLENSLFGNERGAIFFTHAGNEYNALPEILHNTGYYTSVMHANTKTFWNRDLMYPALGYDKYYDIDSFEVNDDNSIGWGLKDIEFFEQSIDLLKTQPEPYYTKFITLTNHFPFELSEQDKLIDEYDSRSRTLNQYVTTARYTDEAIKVFFDRLKEEGLYEDTIFVLYGDHYGISELHNYAMSMLLDKEKITPFDNVQLQRVPMYVHIPGHTNNEIRHTVSGQIDLKPTILNLLGITAAHDIQFGTDLFAPERESFAVLRDGSYITDEFVYTEGKYYDKHTGAEIELTTDELNVLDKHFYERAVNDLYYSDLVTNGDLLRFAY
jgi:uncharacterized sulfatase